MNSMVEEVSEAARWRAFNASQPDASWRREPVTPRQRRALRVLGVRVTPATRGEASDAIGRASERTR